jgi:hypothetical protein
VGLTEREVSSEARRRDAVETKDYAQSQCAAIMLSKLLGSAPPRRNGGEEHLKEEGGHYPELMQQIVTVRLGRPLLAEPLRAVRARPGNEPGM